MPSIAKRPLGNTGLEVTEIGFGAWAIGADWGDVPEEVAIAAVNAGLDAGMNLIDTADIYGGGRSEEIIGKVLKERSDAADIRIITKMGRDADWTDSADSVEAAAVGSCRRLGVETLDLVQLHCIPFETLKRGKVFESLERIREKGLIRHYGASVESVEEGVFCIENSGCASLQVIFNIFRQHLIERLFPLATENGVGIVARVPLASGLLSGKYSPGHQFADSDHRNYNANGECFNVGETFAGVPFDVALEHVGAIEELLESECSGATLAQKALRWILDMDAVSTVIPGAKSASQAQENATAAAVASLSPEAHGALRQLFQEKISETVRGPL